MGQLRISIFLALCLTAALAKRIDIENFQPDPKIKSDDYVDYGTLRITKLGRNNFTGSGDFTVHQNCGNEKTLLLQIKNKETGVVFVKMEEPVCNFFQKEKIVVPDVIAKSNIPEEMMTGMCPFRAGKYSVKNVVFDEKKFSMAPVGNYVARFSLQEGGKTLAAMEVYASIKM